MVNPYRNGSGRDVAALLGRIQKTADWICNNQKPDRSDIPDAGIFPYAIHDDGTVVLAQNWNLAFGIMGLLAAFKAFGNERYAESALRMGRYLKCFQILSPFEKQHYGAIRERSPQCTWCYTRDALSAAWSFIELYRFTGDDEYLERAKLWADWFLRNGMDKDGWPLWGAQLAKPFGDEPPLLNHMQGSFQGGGLNFFYQLYQSSGDRRYIGDFYENIADRMVGVIQQSDGFFRTVDGASGRAPALDPQSNLHRANDDLGTLGLLGAYRVLGKKSYRDGIVRFLDAVFAAQLPDGNFEISSAGTPVVLNIVHESGYQAPPGACEKALDGLMARQYLTPDDPRFDGGFMERSPFETGTGARGNCYALIVLLKLFAGVDGFLSVAPEPIDRGSLSAAGF